MSVCFARLPKSIRRGVVKVLSVYDNCYLYVLKVAKDEPYTTKNCFCVHISMGDETENSLLIGTYDKSVLKLAYDFDLV